MRCPYLLLLLPLAVIAQSPKSSVADETPIIRATTDEVVLDVIARDKRGNSVKNLAPADLAVYDNGVRREITSFRLIEGSQAIVSNARSKAGEPAAAPVKKTLSPLQQIRLVTLIFNRLEINGRQLARTAGFDLLKNEFPPNVYMSVLVLGEKLQALQPFTNDRALLHKAVEHATSGAYNEFISDSNRIREQLQKDLGSTGGSESVGAKIDGMSAGGGGAGAAGAPEGGASANIAMAQMMYNMLQLSQRSELDQTGRAAIYGLLSAVEQQYRLPGRKSILFFSSGFGVPQGMEDQFKTVISTANRFNVTFYAIDASGLNIKSLNQEAVSQLGDATAASRANSRRSTGVVTPAMANAVDTAINAGKANTQDTLAQLAESTGGFLIANSNDFRDPLRRVSEDIETYYEITYNPHIEKYDGAFRKVDVKAERSGLRLQSRSGYFALPSGAASGGPVLTAYEVPLLEALNAKPAPRDFPFQSAGFHFRGPENTPTCSLVMDVPLAPFKLDHDKVAGRYQGTLSYLAIVKNAQGEVVRKFRNEVPLASTTEQVAALRESHFIYTEHFDLPPGRYTLETAVLDRGAATSSVRKTAFVIPSSASSLAISSVSAVRNVAENERASAGDPFKMQTKLVTPALNPAVRKSSAQPLSFYANIYPDLKSADKPQLTLQFQRDGESLGKAESALGDPDPQGRIQYVTTVPTDSFSPGNYQVLFHVQQGKEAVDESVTFTVE